MEKGQQVRFIRAARDGEWAKGDIGIIDAILAERPDATANIYLVKFLHHPEEGVVWATDEDIEPSQGEQLTLF